MVLGDPPIRKIDIDNDNIYNKLKHLEERVDRLTTLLQRVDERLQYIESLNTPG